MVAITVILAAVIGTFVLGLGDQVQSTSPQAQFTFDYTNSSAAEPGDSLTVTHDGGDSIGAARLNASVSGAIVRTDGSGDNSFGTPTNTYSGRWVGDLFTGSDVGAGAADTLEGGSDWKYDSGTTFDTGASGTDVHLDLSEATVGVVWTSESGDSSATLGKWDGPDA